MALLLALAIIAIGTQYVANPRTATRSFGLHGVTAIVMILVAIPLMTGSA
jgi:hypothetical protein